MGAWGVGPFDNDGALDALGVLDGIEDLAGGLASGMRELADADGYLEAPELSGAVALACLVAARSRGAEDDAVASGWLCRNLFAPTGALREAARATLERATRADGNELWELWEESGSLDEWLTSLAPYQRAVSP